MAIFRWVNVGLGCFGVVSQITFQCVDDHFLKEKTDVLSWDTKNNIHNKILFSNRHAKYLWYPNTRSILSISSKSTTIPPEFSDQNETKISPTLRRYLRVIFA